MSGDQGGAARVLQLRPPLSWGLPVATLGLEQRQGRWGGEGGLEGVGGRNYVRVSLWSKENKSHIFSFGANFKSCYMVQFHLLWFGVCVGVWHSALPSQITKTKQKYIFAEPLIDVNISAVHHCGVCKYGFVHLC